MASVNALMQIALLHSVLKLEAVKFPVCKKLPINWLL